MIYLLQVLAMRRTQDRPLSASSVTWYVFASASHVSSQCSCRVRSFAEAPPAVMMQQPPWQGGQVYTGPMPESSAVQCAQQAECSHDPNL